MIALNEPDAFAAEVPFTLPLAADPLTGLTGHVFTPGEVEIRLPGAVSWTAVLVGNLVEKGYGRFAARLTPAQCAVAGTVPISATVAGAQPYRGAETIGTAGGEIAEGGTGYLMFYLANASDPVYGAPISGTFASQPGAVIRVCLPNGVYAAALPAEVTSFGNGLHGLPISGATTALRGKIYYYAICDGAQPFEAYVTVLTSSDNAVVAPAPPPPVIDPPPVRPAVPAPGACWDGSAVSVFEARLRQPLPTYGLESLRQAVLHTLAPDAPVKAARLLLQLSYETELRVVLTKHIDPPPSTLVLASRVCERRSFLAMDATLRSLQFLVNPALTELAAVPTIPAPYVDLLRTYVGAAYPRYRVCALTTLLCLATAVLTP